MRLVIRGHHLPGQPPGPYGDLHIGIQVGDRADGLTASSADSAEWVTEIQVLHGDFTGPAVQGRKGARFVYLTWGTNAGEQFTMLSRAKLMLADLPHGREHVVVDIDLTDERGMPRCARLRAPALTIRDPVDD